MTGWVKVPEDWFSSEEIERLPAQLVLFHLSALAESGRQLLNGRVPATAVRRLWLVTDPDTAIRELVTTGLWLPLEAGGWQIRDWRTFLLSAEEIEHKRAQSRESSERYRRHKAGDHSMCDRCLAVRGDKSGDVSRHASVTPLEPIRSDPKGRRSGEGDGPAFAGASPTVTERGVPYPPHEWLGDCCPLPDVHPVHERPREEIA